MQEENDPVEYKIVDQGEGGDIPTGKKRGRRPNAMALEGKTEEEIEAVEAEIALDQRLALIDERFGDGQGYDRTRIEIEIRTCLQTFVEAYLKTGARLIQLKEHEGHGGFLPALKRIGVSEDVAQHAMATARKLQGTAIANSVPVRNLPPTKLYEISIFDPETFDELERQCKERGSDALDDFDRMTLRELRAFGRDARQKHKAEIAALEQVVQKKNEIINKQELQISLRPEPSELQVIDGKLRALEIHFISECVKLQVAMRQMRDVLDDASRLPGLELYKARLGDFRDEIVRYGTEAVIAEWEELTNEVENLSPKSELPDVPPLG